MLGAVQGLTEFVPISSSGHLVLVPEVLGWRQPGLAFDVLLHAASLVALLLYFSGDLIGLARGVLAGDRRSRRLVILLAVGSIPAGLAGIALGDFFEGSFTDARASAVQLVVTAIILVAAEIALAYHLRRNARTERDSRRVDHLTPVDAGVIGAAQAISILPGVSRSGSTIGAGLALGMDRADAGRFAFLLGIPALFGAALVEIPDLGQTPLGWGAGLAGFLASLATSYATVAALLHYLRDHTLYPFAAYCLVAGVLFYVLV